MSHPYSHKTKKTCLDEKYDINRMLNKFGKNRRIPLITIKNGSNIAEIRINCKDKLIINTLEPKGNEKKFI